MVLCRLNRISPRHNVDVDSNTAATTSAAANDYKYDTNPHVDGLVAQLGRTARDWAPTAHALALRHSKLYIKYMIYFVYVLYIFLIVVIFFIKLYWASCAHALVLR